MPYRSSEDDYQCAKHLTAAASSVLLLAVLPNSTILEPSEPKTCPAVLCHRLAGDPSDVCRKSSPLFLTQALMNYTC